VKTTSRCSRSALFALLLAAACLALPGPAAWAIGAEQIIREVERNQVHDSEIAEGAMIITDRFGSRTKTFKSWAEGSGRMLLEFTNPEERGQKILRLENEIYLYFPEAEQIIHLQGAALKESVMGSDFSYEDLTGEKGLLELYGVTLLGSETVSGGEQYRLELKARERGVAYPLQRIWVDVQDMVLMKAEYYGLSGRLLKTFEVLEVRRVGGKNVPVRAVMRDAMKRGSATEFRLDSLQLDVPLPAGIFSLAELSW
jgi:outer membrane lipoprotein-sorting protein